MSLQELKEVSRCIREAALAAADPVAAVRRSLSATAHGFEVRDSVAVGPAAHGSTAAGSSAGVREYRQEGRLLLLSVGKASVGMADAALAVLGARVTEGIVVAPQGYLRGYPRGAVHDPRIVLLEAGHPIPDQQGLDAAQRVMALVDGMTDHDLCLFLLSGGGSSLLPLPQPPVSLRDKRDTTSLLLKSGADIHEMNTVRKHLSAIKGGRLAAKCRGTIVTLAISDVVGDELGFIASGPSVADNTTFADAIGVLERHDLLSLVPGSVRALLEHGRAGMVPETPKVLPDRFHAVVIASGSQAAAAAAEEARRQGFAPLVLTTRLAGEAREAGRWMAGMAREVKSSSRPVPAPACIIAAGETTVTVKGDGKGGRNQEIALSAAIELSGVSGILLCSFATDGCEGNTDAAGAFASGETFDAGRRAGFDPGACLAANDSHAFLSTAGELIVTGPTGTNVNDITFALVEEENAR